MPKTKRTSLPERRYGDHIPLHTLRGGVELKSVFGSIGMQFPPIAFLMYYNTRYGPAMLTTDMSWTNKLKAMNF